MPLYLCPVPSVIYILLNLCVCILCIICYYQLSHGCQGDTEKYLTRGNLYHPRHTCITRDVVEGNTDVSRVIQVFEGQILLRITLATM